MVPDACTQYLHSSTSDDIICLIFSSSVLVLSESTRISCATTAKPFPASPALAASIDALSDKRLVSLDISSMTETILLTLSTVVFTVSMRFEIAEIPSSILWLLSCMDLILSFMILLLSCTATVWFLISSTEALMSFVSLLISRRFSLILEIDAAMPVEPSATSSTALDISLFAASV